MDDAVKIEVTPEEERRVDGTQARTSSVFQNGRNVISITHEYNFVSPNSFPINDYMHQAWDLRFISDALAHESQTRNKKLASKIFQLACETHVHRKYDKLIKLFDYLKRPEHRSADIIEAPEVQKYNRDDGRVVFNTTREHFRIPREDIVDVKGNHPLLPPPNHNPINPLQDTMDPCSTHDLIAEAWSVADTLKNSKVAPMLVRLATETHSNRRYDLLIKFLNDLKVPADRDPYVIPPPPSFVYQRCPGKLVFNSKNPEYAIPRDVIQENFRFDPAHQHHPRPQPPLPPPSPPHNPPALPPIPPVVDQNNPFPPPVPLNNTNFPLTNFKFY